MSVSTIIKNQIKSKVEACSSVDKVYGYEEINPKGWPAVMITVADLSGEFASNQENSRVYAYKVLILFPTGQNMPGLPVNTNRVEYAENVVATVVDEIIDAVDDDYELDGTPVLFVNAADAQWRYTAYEGGEARSAELTLNVYTQKVI